MKDQLVRVGGGIVSQVFTSSKDNVGLSGEILIDGGSTIVKAEKDGATFEVFWYGDVVADTKATTVLSAGESEAFVGISKINVTAGTVRVMR